MIKSVNFPFNDNAIYLLFLGDGVLLSHPIEGIHYSIEMINHSNVHSLVTYINNSLKNYEDKFHNIISDVFINFRNRVSFDDYSKKETFIEDSLRMDEYRVKDDTPKSTPLHKRSIFNKNERELHDITKKKYKYTFDLIKKTFSVIGRKKFHNHSVSLKAIPSIGGRHGLEVYILFPGIMNDKKISNLFYFNPYDKEIIYVRSFNLFSNIPKLYISCIFEKYQWRYRHSWIYQCIWLDLGHAIEHLKILIGDSGSIYLSYPDNTIIKEYPFIPFINHPIICLEFIFFNHFLKNKNV